MNVLEHAIDIRQHVVVPVSHYAVGVRFENSRAPLISRRSVVLASIDLDDDAGRVTSKIDDVAVNTNLPTEMRARCWNSMAQVPPKLPLGVRWSSAQGAGEATLRWHDLTITLGPDSRLVSCRHIIVSLQRPPPPAPPHKGEGSRLSLPLANGPTRSCDGPSQARAAARLARRGGARSVCMSLRTELRFSRSPTASMVPAMAEGASTPSA